MKFARVLAGFFFLLSVLACESGFTVQDIEELKKSVRSEFEAQPGVVVSEVAFIKESSTKLTGFVKFELYGIEVIKGCEATMGENQMYIWRCQ